MTKVTIFSGFLGAGKTTLIKQLIQKAYTGEKLVLIENEFGEIGIDGGFMQDAGIEVTEMNSGCICCSLVGDFGQALQKVLATYAPDRILIEPSGVGKLSDVIAAVQKQPIDVTPAGFVTVVDVNKCGMYLKNFGAFYNDQIEHASAIFVSRTAKAAQDKLDDCAALLRARNAHAPIVTTPWDALTGAQLLAVIEQKDNLQNELAVLARTASRPPVPEAEKECPACGHVHSHAHHGEECACHSHEHAHHGGECACHSHEHAHHGEECACHSHEHAHHSEECACHAYAHDVFTSWGKESPRLYTQAEIEFCLAALDSGAYGTVLRAKGIVPCAQGGWLHFDYVPGEHEVRSGSAAYTGRVCVIGVALAQDALAQLWNVQ